MPVRGPFPLDLVVADAVTNGSIVDWAASLILAVMGVVVVYRAMQRPRLALVERDGQWRTSARNTVLYGLTILPLLFLWWFFLAVALFLSPTGLTGSGVIVISAAVVVAVRILAHIWPEPAHELAKSIPLTLVTIVLISRSTRPDVDEAFTELEEVTFGPQAGLALILVEFGICALWYWLGVRVLAPRGWRIPGVPSRGPNSAAGDIAVAVSSDALADPTTDMAEATDGPALGGPAKVILVWLTVGFVVIFLVAATTKINPLSTVAAIILALAVGVGFAFRLRRPPSDEAVVDALVGILLAVGIAVATLMSWWFLVGALAVAGGAQAGSLRFKGRGFGYFVVHGRTAG